jgi:nucleotide-binding universal stress UspA family protein
MFKHILIPTDGSEISSRAISAAMGFAKETGARVTGYYAMQKSPIRVFGEGYQFPDVQTAQNFEKSVYAAGSKYVAQIARAAHKAGVKFQSLLTQAPTPYEGIVEAARKSGCDAIFMASHGRKGLARVALGSVTSKVLTHSKLPVLVYR